VDVARLQDTPKVRPIGRAAAQALNSGLLVPEGLEESERKLHGIERTLRKAGYSFFNFNSVHS
jgi:hypothetical protein